MGSDVVRRTLTVPEAARLLGLSVDTVYRKVADGEWPHTRLTRKITFTPEQVDEILRRAAVPSRLPERHLKRR